MFRSAKAGDRRITTSCSSRSRYKQDSAGLPQADLVVWPESSAPFFLNDERFVSTISAIARRTNDFVVAGGIGVRPAAGGENLVYNSAALVNPQGQITARYDKVHLVPFGEYIPLQRLLSFAQSLTHEVGMFARGSDRWPLDAGTEKLGVFICYESVFPGEVRQFADHGAQVFVNISNDGWYWQLGGSRAAPERGTHARHRERALAAARDEHGNYRFHRSIWPRGGASSARAREPRCCSLFSALRDHFLHPIRRLVPLPVCDNFPGRVAVRRRPGAP